MHFSYQVLWKAQEKHDICYSEEELCVEGIPQLMYEVSYIERLSLECELPHSKPHT